MGLSVVIPAAGQGKRMKTEKNKQFLMLDDKEVLAHTISKFENSNLVDEIIVVARADEISYCENKVVQNYDFTKVVKVIAGGSTRQESVYNGLQEVAESSDFILIHDGVRPFITGQLIEKVVAEVKEYEAAAVGVSVKDTIKVINSDTMIINTPDRSKLVAIQTPQAFKKDLIMDAYQQAVEDGFVGTDSSSLVERLDKTVKLIEGSYENIKLTTPEDLELGEIILSRRN
ncbi:MAG: 2-C-methyl-D-erythritol 4-phosphate cytidylyltransferase [Bacillota bacterium]